jgi:hypothetical protein
MADMVGLEGETAFRPVGREVTVQDNSEKDAMEASRNFICMVPVPYSDREGNGEEDETDETDLSFLGLPHCEEGHPFGAYYRWKFLPRKVRYDVLTTLQCVVELLAGREFFVTELERDLFLMYGTLLGYCRSGDFIAGDDDFDAGYVSDATDPPSVKDETFDIIVDLVREGFTVTFNRKGRLLRVQLEPGPDQMHIDLRPLWLESGDLWVHNHVCLPLSRADFLPTRQASLRGVPVNIPQDTEAFLRGHYGPGWNVPDPGFIYYPSEVDPAVRRHLDRALITVAEYRELAARVERACEGVTGAGRLVSLGSQDLYPLDSYIR